MAALAWPPMRFLRAVAEALAASGLIVRGGFDFAAVQLRRRPRPPRHRAAGAAVLLVGQAGAAPWPHFQRWLARKPGGGPDNPLDSWAREVIGEVAGIPARGRCRRPTGLICRSSNGRCAPKG